MVKFFQRMAALAILGAGILTAAPPEVAVAAAANLADVMPVIARAFEADNGIHPVFSFGSTAQLAQQIASGAPFDLILAADTEHVDALIGGGSLVRASRSIYATGVLALWIPPQSQARIGSVADLTSPSVRVIAIAKPELAPYGQASVDTLMSLGLWDRVKGKAVYAGSISMAKEYGITGNADAVFTAWSLVLHEKGQIIQIDEKWHKPILQAMGVVTASKNRKSAQIFANFVMGPKGRAIFSQYGYR